MQMKSYYQGSIPILEKLEKAIYVISGILLVVAASGRRRGAGCLEGPRRKEKG